MTTSDENHTTLKVDTIEELYELIAKYKVDNEYGEEKRYGNYGRIKFSNITKVVLECNVDENLIENTSAWKEHLDKLENEARIEREKKSSRRG